MLLFFSLPFSASAYHILFYYNSLDGTEGGLLQCVTILQRSGHQVTPIDVHGVQRDPSGDDWGAPYDQVWDMRFVDRETRGCGNGLPGASDYFDESWRKKSINFLNHCGKLFIAGEHYQMGDRTEGLYRFLKEIGAVKKSFDDCPPSRRGNSTTEGTSFYPVHSGLGPQQFFGAWVGGIPLSELTGKSFVDTREDWEGDDHVDRSVVSGWRGSQLEGGAVVAPSCGEERLFMVWDATMWTLWQPGAEDESRPDGPIWDETGWFSYNTDGTSKGNLREFIKARTATRKFFPAIAQWLGARESCPCAGKGTVVPNPAPTPNPEPTLQIASNRRAPPQSRLSADQRTTTSIQPVDPNAPATILFNSLPVNLYMLFLDGPGVYQLDIWNSQNILIIKNIYAKDIRTQKDDWALWDGTDSTGNAAGLGTYVAVLSKEGRILRKIVLTGVKP